MRAARVAAPIAAGLLVLSGGLACTRAAVVPPGADLTASASPAPSATPSPTPPPLDPAVTLQICVQAFGATSAATKIFNDQIAALEQAAAANDQAAMVAAAEAINKQFTSLAVTLTQYAQQPVSPELKTVLTDIATALTQMSSLSYTGTTVDIRKKLLDFAAALNKTCATPSLSPSAAQ